MKMARWLVLAVGLLAVFAGSADPVNAIMRLLNSRVSGSRKGFAEAAEEVAAQAKEGHPIYAFVLALVSREPDAPAAARLDRGTRQKYLDGCRDRIQALVDRGNSMACYLLALENDDTNLLHRAAKAGNVQAQNAWGAHLISDVAPHAANADEAGRIGKEAFECFRRAAGTGDANGLYNLGTCYACAVGTTPDDRKAFECFRAAAERGHPEAINNIGGFFREGRIVERNLEMSAKWFAKSASYDNPFGQFNYALALQRGEGVDKDEKAAVKLFRKAAEGGCVEAIAAYGVALWKGRGVRQDEDAAFRQFLLAAEAGCPPAMENLSTCYERGTGVAADARLAMEWKIKARAARGDRHAKEWLLQNAKTK